jgi:uncharacterized protein (DUF58 family)
MKLFTNWSGKRKAGVAFAGAFVLLLLAACLFFRVSSRNDVEAYIGMAQECHPIWKQFAFRRFGAGDSAAVLFRSFSPDRRDEFGRYGVYQYYLGPGGIHFSGITVTTRDGRLLTAGAGSCTWQYYFFHVVDTNIDREYYAYMRKKHPEYYGDKKP